MEQHHKYEYKVNADSAGSKVLRMVGSDKRILEIGAGPGSITSLLKNENNCRVTAVELDKEAIIKLSQFCEQVYSCDLNDSVWSTTVIENGMFDVVVAADVLEHLSDPKKVLLEMKTVLNEAGYMVISLPHVGHNGVILNLIQGCFDYREWGLLDKTHIRFFCVKNIQQLFNEAGLKILEAEFVVRSPLRTEFADDWRAAPNEIKKILKKNKFGNVYQVVIKAVSGDFSEGISLTSMKVPKAKWTALDTTTFLGKFAACIAPIVHQFISLDTQRKILKIINRLGLRL